MLYSTLFDLNSIGFFHPDFCFSTEKFVYYLFITQLLTSINTKLEFVSFQSVVTLLFMSIQPTTTTSHENRN